MSLESSRSVNGTARSAPPFRPSAAAARPASQETSLTISDIYYIVFRHKWKIVICSLLGLAAGAAVLFTAKPTYFSEARLFVRYVVSESNSIGAMQGDSKKSPDMRGETIMQSEMQILSSLDLAKKVAEVIGPDKILGSEKNNEMAGAAAMVIQKGLVVSNPWHSSIITISFQHDDPEVVQPVLRELVDQYLKMHVSIHTAVGMVGDVLTQETDQLRSRLAQTNEELRRANAKAGGLTIEQARANCAGEIAGIKDAILKAEAELAERQAVFEGLTKQTTASSPSTPSVAAPAPVTAAEIETYRAILTRIGTLRAQEAQHLSQFTEENPRVREVRQLLADAEKQRAEMENTFPALTAAQPTAATAGGSPPNPSDLRTEALRLVALQTRIKTLESQLEKLREEAVTLDRLESEIVELRRRRDLEAERYRNFSATLEQARLKEAVGAGKVSNITPVQTPSLPIKVTEKTSKKAGMVAGAGIGLGIAWAILIEFFLDRTVRRPTDVERHLRVPLFLSVPRLRRRQRRDQNSSSTALPQLPGGASNSPADAIVAAGEGQAATPATAPLRAFHDTLRDRLIGYFESENLTHKPKLIAVTGLGRGTGVTTLTAGLASSLSATRDGNVLLVDLTREHGAAQQFAHGKATCDIEDMFSARDSAQVQDNLYVVVENAGHEAISRNLPQRFNTLVPKLKASDFDYIIFDMPPVSQISITPRLAGFMDMVLMVVESEKTDQQTVQKACSLLTSANARVGVVLNKTREYVPKWLHRDTLLDHL